MGAEAAAQAAEAAAAADPAEAAGAEVTAAADAAQAAVVAAAGKGNTAHVHQEDELYPAIPAGQGRLIPRARQTALDDARA